MKLSVFFDHLKQAAQQKNMPLDEILKAARDCGIEGVEINLSSLKDASVPEALEKAGLKISCVFAFHDWADTADYSSGIRQIDAALQYGAEAVMAVPGQLSGEEAGEMTRLMGNKKAFVEWLDASERVQRQIEGVRKMIEYSAGRLPVFMEDFDAATAPYAGINGLDYFLQSCPGLRLAFDTGNFAYSDECSLEAFGQLGQYTAHVHCKDRGEEKATLAKQLNHNRGLAPVPVGFGYIPVGRIVSKLLSGGYDGWLAIEHYGAPDQLGYMRKSAAYLSGLNYASKQS